MEESKKKYICPMHPDIIANAPGQCSKCGMILVKKEEEGNHSSMDHTMAMSTPEASHEFLRRFYIVTILLIPLIIFSSPVSRYLGFFELATRKYIEFGIATVIFYFGLIFFEHAKMEIRTRKYGMMTLVSLGVGSGYLFSTLSTFVPTLNIEFYLEIATLIWVLLFGHFLEARSSAAAGDALSEVAKLLPKAAHLKTSDGIKDVQLHLLKVGDVVLIKPGEKAPADGEITKGESTFNEAHLTGESEPIEKLVGDEIPAGAICIDGSVEIRLLRVGEASTIGQIKSLIASARSTKPSIQKLADRAAKWLTFSALGVSIATLIFWSLIAGQPLVFAATLAITVLVIACPHALGLAIPTVSTIATKLAVANGLFIKDMSKIEVIKSADCVVFDKTGTLTRGNFAVTNQVDKEVLRIAAGVEQYSQHPIARAIIMEAKSRKIKIPETKNFKATTGWGVEGVVDGEKIKVGRPGVSVYKNEELIGDISVEDEIRPESRKSVSELHNLGIKVAMLTGDKKEVADKIGKALGVDTIYSEVLPEDKYKYIRELQENGNVVIMSGDGVNDAPALTQANAGVAVGAGTDVAIEAGDVVLTQSNPMSLVKLVVLSKKVYKKMIQNLFWAAGYNVVAIPMAAGAFFKWGIVLRPEVGAILMSMSSLVVVTNALLLRKARL